MEFSDDYSTFQLKSLSHKVMDFSTDYASLTLRRRRRSNSVRTNSFTQHSTRSITSTMRRMTCMVGGVVVLLVAVGVPSLLKNTTDTSDMNYLTMWEEGDLSSLTMVAQKGNIMLEQQDASSTAEALNSLRAALEMARLQKNAKAKNCFCTPLPSPLTMLGHCSTMGCSWRRLTMMAMILLKQITSMLVQWPSVIQILRFKVKRLLPGEELPPRLRLLMIKCSRELTRKRNNF